MLRELELDLPDNPDLPPGVTTLLDEVERRSDDFYDAGLHKKIPSIIPSKPIVQFKAIQAVTDMGVVVGRNFCEWGSGFGTAALLASLLGYDAVGVEIEPILVDFSQQLGAELGIAADFLETSYFPEGLDQFTEDGGSGLVSESDDFLNFEIKTESDEDEVVDFFYEGMELALSEIDLFYVYPYPGDQEMFLDLFDKVAGVDAVLLTNYEDGAVGAYVKI
ncbi:MAG: hypothetical protein ACKVJU_00405 [Verrucomicrobiales bacterium]